MATLTTTANEQATKGIRFKLWCATKQDYRTANITQAQAEQILGEANAKNGYQPKHKATAVSVTTGRKHVPSAKPKATLSNPLEQSARAHIVANIDTLIHSICEEVDIVSVVKNDTNFLPDDGKRFKMFGGGCGFAWLAGFRKTEKNLKLAAVIGGLHKFADELTAEMMPADVRKVLEDNGSLWPLLAQSLEYNSAWAWVQIKWLETQGVKGARVESRLD